MGTALGNLLHVSIALLKTKTVCNSKLMDRISVFFQQKGEPAIQGFAALEFRIPE